MKYSLALARVVGAKIGTGYGGWCQGDPSSGFTGDLFRRSFHQTLARMERDYQVVAEYRKAIKEEDKKKASRLRKILIEEGLVKPRRK